MLSRPNIVEFKRLIKNLMTTDRQTLYTTSYTCFGSHLQLSHRNVSTTDCSYINYTFYLTTGRFRFLPSHFSYELSWNTAQPTSGGKWKTTDCQIKEWPCIQSMEINAQPYHKLLHWRQKQSVLPKRRYPTNDPSHCVQRHRYNRRVTVVTQYSCYTHYVGSNVLYLQHCYLHYRLWTNFNLHM